MRIPRDPVGEVIIVRRDPRLAFRIVETKMNYGYLGDRLSTSAAENFPQLVGDLRRLATAAYLTPTTTALLDGGDPEEFEFASSQSLLDYATLRLLWSWYRRDRDKAGHERRNGRALHAAVKRPSTDRATGSTVGGVADVDVGDEAGPSVVAGPDGFGEGFGVFGPDEVDGAAGPACSRELAARKPGDSSAASKRASRAGSCSRNRLGWRHARLTSRPQSGSRRPIGGPRPLGSLVRSRSGRDGPGAGRRGRGSTSRRGAGRASRRGAGGSSCRASGLERGDDPLALGPSAVVHPVGQPSGGLGVADHDRRRGVAERQEFVFERPAVEHEGVIGLAEQARKLVEQARGDTDELVFRTAQGLGQVEPVGLVGVAPPGELASPKPARKRANAACKLAELEKPAPSGTSPARAASKPEVIGP